MKFVIAMVVALFTASSFANTAATEGAAHHKSVKVAKKAKKAKTTKAGEEKKDEAPKADAATPEQAPAPTEQK